MERYARVFKPVEVKMMLAAFSNMETVHIAAYAAAAGDHRHAGERSFPPSSNTRR